MKIQSEERISPKLQMISKYIKNPCWTRRGWFHFYYMLLLILNGMPQKAISQSSETLSDISQKGRLHYHLFNAYFVIATAHASLGEKDKAQKLLSRIIPFTKKHQLLYEKNIIEIILERKRRKEPDANSFPNIKLLYLLQRGSYFTALSYAKEKHLFKYFYQYIFFFPNTVRAALRKTKNIELPKAMLKLPVFNKQTPVFKISFLSRQITVEKNKEQLNVKLKRKDQTFLIHLALKAENPDAKIPLESIYDNFWRDKKDPKNNFGHLMVRLREALKIPAHLLAVSQKDNTVNNNGMYFTTDYGDYKQAVSNANAFLKGNEWKLAKHEFLTALKLIKSAPFQKMYDDWSDELLRTILNGYENEMLSFAKECVKRRERKLAKNMLKKIEKITGHAHKIEELELTTESSET